MRPARGELITLVLPAVGTHHAMLNLNIQGKETSTFTNMISNSSSKHN